jgi:hypothetical protein
MKYDVEIPRATKVLVIFSAAMMLNDKHPDTIFSYTEMEPNAFVMRCNPRGASNIAQAQAVDIPIDEIFNMILSEMNDGDPTSPIVAGSALNTLYHYSISAFGLQSALVIPDNIDEEPIKT